MKISVNTGLANLFIRSPDSETVCKSDDSWKENHVGKPLQESLSKSLRYHVQDGCCKLEYRFFKTGQQLASAGIISSVRVYSKHDPFTLPGKLNDILMSSCVNFDMSKAYPRFLLSLSRPKTTAHRLLSEFLATDLQPIAGHYGVTRAAAKTLIHALCMDGKVETWRVKHGVDDCVKDTLFIREFALAMRDLTSEFANTEQGKQAISIISKKRKRDAAYIAPPERTWKSFLLQSIECRVREAMMACLHANGAVVHTQEHDGVRAMLPDGADPAEFEAMLTKAATEALGSDCPVCIKPVDVSFTSGPADQQDEEEVAFLNHEVAAQLFLASDERHLHAYTNDGWRAFSEGVWHEHGASDLIQRSLYQVVSSKLTKTAHLEKLGNLQFLKGCVELCQVHLFDANFDETLDVNTNLVAFDDGWLFERGVGYRETRPGDRVSKTVGYAHTAVTATTRHDDARQFFASLFPEAEMEDYMLRILAAALFNAPIGEFYLLVGGGSNGKTVMMSLLKRAFGAYFKDLPHQVITQVQKDSEAPSPQLACTQGCRLCNTAEPSESDTIQTSRLKLLAGNGRLTIRQLYKQPVDVFVRFKLLMSVNDVPDLSSSGNSVAWRFRMLPFQITFTDHPSGEHERQANSEYESDEWRAQIAPALLSILLDTPQPTTRNIPCPQIVTDLSNEHFRTVLDDLANYLERHSRLEDSADDATTMVVFKATILQHLRAVRRRKVSLGCLKNQMAELGYLEHEAHRSTGEHVRGWKKYGMWLIVDDF